MVVIAFVAVALLAFPGCRPNSNDAASAIEARVRPAPPERPELREELFEAIVGDNEPRAIELVDQGAPVNSVNRNGLPALFLSAGGCIDCEGVMPELTRRLLEYGADPRAAIRGGIQAIHWVARSGAGGRIGAQETVDLLLLYGADINAETDDGMRPLDYVFLLLEVARGDGNTTAEAAAEEWMQFLITRGAQSPKYGM